MDFSPAIALPASAPWRVLGLMSGTSADGVDAALAEIDPAGFRDGRPLRRLLGHRHEAYPEDLRQAVLDAAADRLPPSGICILQRRLGDHHAAVAAAIARECGPAHLASLHGQTVQHWPGQGATLQLADPYVLAETLGCPVVWDLRRRDMALDGQGAPLVPLTELWLHGRGEPWVSLNLGGIANATIWDGQRIRAWDLGPAMSLLDLAAIRWLDRPFDPGGRHASGRADEGLIEGWMRHPHFVQAPPKSTGREVFGQAWLEAQSGPLEALALEDRLATLAAFTAEAVAREIHQWAPPLPLGTPLRLSGGGASHGRVLRELALRLPECTIEEDRELPQGSREAVSWALLGAASACGIPGALPEVTGARRAAVLGSWVFP